MNLRHPMGVLHSFSTKNIHKQVYILTKTLMNILFSIISNKLISLTEKDLPWLIDYLEKSIKGPFNRTSEKWKRLPRSAYCQLAK